MASQCALLPAAHARRRATGRPARTEVDSRDGWSHLPIVSLKRAAQAADSSGMSRQARDARGCLRASARGPFRPDSRPLDVMPKRPIGRAKSPDLHTTCPLRFPASVPSSPPASDSHTSHQSGTQEPHRGGFGDVGTVVSRLDPPADAVDLEAVIEIGSELN